MSRLQSAIKKRQSAGQKTFVAYMTAGDPNLEETFALAQTLSEAGVDILELGVPFSDPLADGPINQRAAERGLASGTSLAKILEKVAIFRQSNQELALVIFSYLNPIYRMGFEQFARAARIAGVDGVLIVDFPPEEADAYRHMMQAEGLDTVFLASPTSDEIRLKHVDEQSTGFVYYVSRTGVTGMQAELSQSLDQEMGLVRSCVKKPVMLGFGISDSKQAVAAAKMGDGIIIGSAIVKIIEEAKNSQERLKNVHEFAMRIRQSLDLNFRS
ncbi:MAG: tryptophan synthase subunit alpha [Proteobacteria bacterium]|nr:tryptophan synthase subunit alpha [Pseudomonadota bacterium]